jgi:hypothetical protein
MMDDEFRKKILKKEDDEKFLKSVEEIILGLSEYKHTPTAENVLVAMLEALATLRAGKPSERSELARRYSVAITEMEKVVAYFKTYVVDDDRIPNPPTD